MEDILKVFVIGATGFAGRYVVNELVKQGHEPVLLSRQKNAQHNHQPPPLPTSSLVEGDILDSVSLEKGVSGCDAVIHLVGIIRETGRNTFMNVHYKGTKHVVDASLSAGASRFIHMSAEGTKPHALSQYHQTKFMAEEYLKSSGLNYTIFRPSMLFGPGDKNFTVLADLIRKAPVIPVIGDGNYKWQPASVRNVAELFVLALENKKAENKTYEIRGPDVFTFNEVLDIIMDVIGVKKPTVHIPVRFAKPIINLLEKILPSPFITSDQLKMLLDDYDHQIDDVLTDFNIKLLPFKKGLREYLNLTDMRKT
jgi:NADH dehydrogenase